MVETALNQLHMCARIMHVRRIPKVSIIMAVTTKLVTEKAKKWQDFGQNRAVMAGSWHGRYLFINVYGTLSFVPSSVAPGHLGRPVSPTLS